MQAEHLITGDDALHALSPTREGRRQLLQQLQQVTAWTRWVKVHLNATTPPISRLPRELLAEIFHILSATEPRIPLWPSASSVTGTSRTRPSRLGWIAVTHVCREWRELALGSPGLWRHISFSLGSRWAKLMYSRSCSMPLAVRAHVSHPLQSLKDALRIAQHLSRTQELHLSASADCLPTFLKHLNTKASVLHTLSLTAEPHSLGANEHEIPVPEFDLLSCGTPALRHLSIRNVFVSFQQCSTLQNLRALSIVLPSDNNTTWHLDTPKDLRLARFLDTLAYMPDLEELTLHGGALPLVDRSALKVMHEVLLPRLVRLELDGDIKTVAAVLKHLLLPLVTDVRLMGSFNERMHGGVETQALFCYLAQLLVPDGWHSPNHGAVSLATLLRRLSVQRLHVGSHDLSSSFTFDTLFPKLFAAIQRAPLSINIACLNLFAPQWFDALCGHAKVIRSITIDGTSFDSFLDFLHFGCVGVVGEVLPHLEVLRLRNFAPTNVMRRAMVVWLRARKGRKAALQKVIFDRCHRDTLPGRWLDELREVMSGWDYNAVVLENSM